MNYPAVRIHTAPRIFHFGRNGWTASFPKPYRNVIVGPLDRIPTQVSNLDRRL